MALCYLPQEHIQPSFQRFKEGIDPEQSPKLMDLTKYIEKTWITSSVWPVHSWSFNKMYYKNMRLFIKCVKKIINSMYPAPCWDLD
jgi:hypothetical protein